MTREQLAHLLRAASQITDDTDVVVIGSQSILGTYTEAELPEAAFASQEADLTFFNDPDNHKSDQVDGVLGEDSQFHATFGYYGQGVSLSTATLPAGWQDRIVVLKNQSTRPGHGLCLEPHDLVVSKLVAGREKDFEFAAAMLDSGLLDAAVLRQRTGSLEVIPAVQRRVIEWIDSRVHEEEEPPQRALLDELEPFTWSDQESVGYEVALEAIGEVIGVYSGLIAAEEAKPEPDQAAINAWELGQARCSEHRRTLDPTDHAEVARVRSEYPQLARRLRAHGR